MQYIIEHADEIEKLIKVKAQVSEVKNIMLDNIEKVRRIKCGIQKYWTLGLISRKKNKERGKERYSDAPDTLNIMLSSHHIKFLSKINVIRGTSNISSDIVQCSCLICTAVPL
jgi:hypothetical protein